MSLGGKGGSLPTIEFLYLKAALYVMFAQRIQDRLSLRVADAHFGRV